MSKRTFRFLAVAALVMGSLRAEAGNNPFVGKWKLNPSKSKLTVQMKIEAAGANRYAITSDTGTVDQIVADGTDQPSRSGTTVSVTVEGTGIWKVVRKKQGRTLLNAVWKLSEDGKALSDVFTRTQPDGSVLSMQYVYRRIAGSSGFLGTWESASEKLNSVVEFRIQRYDGGGLSFITPSEHEVQNIRFDGKDYPDTGPDVVQGFASSGHLIDERTLEITDKIKGKVVGTEHLMLSSDLKSLTMTVRQAGQGSPNIFVFDRE